MNARGKTVDTTFLSIETAAERGFIHRDYIAHVLRWSHVAKFLMGQKRYQNATILDIGCGREIPMAMMLYSMKMSPKLYVGVDYGKVDDEVYQNLTKTGKFQAEIYEEEDFVTVDLGLLKPNVITCFEVLEHVEPLHMIAMLKRAYDLLDDNGDAFFSTPCWNVVDCADNHVNEIKYEVLGSIFERLTWCVQDVYGTFASIKDYEHLLNPSQHAMFNLLRSYYDSNFLSCIFAPMFPGQSRNCLWHLKKRINGYQNKFPEITNIPEPWSSSTRSRDLATV